MYIDGYYRMLCIRNCSVLLMKSMKVYREISILFMWWTHFEHFGLLKNNNKKKHSELKVSVKWIKKLNFNDPRNKNCREPHP